MKRLAAVGLLVLPLALSACAAGSTTQKTVGAPASSSAPSTSTSSSSAPAATYSPSPTPSPTKDKSTYTNLALGTPISVTGKSYSTGDFAYSVTAGTPQTSKRAVSTYGSKPKVGSFVGITITYDCTSGSCDYNPYDFTLRSPDGTEIDQSFEGFEPALHSGTLNVGTKAKGVITYDLAAGSYSLEYRTGALDGDAASWVVPVA